MRASHLLSIALVVAGICASAAPAIAQQQVQASPITIRGRITGTQGYLITVNGEGGPVVVNLDPSRKDGNLTIPLGPPVYDIKGTGGLESIERNMMVRFAVELDNRKPVGDVIEITIVGLETSGDVVPGLQLEGEAAAPAVPAINGEAPKQPKPAAAPTTATTGKFIVTGSVTSYKAGNLNINYGGKRTIALQVKVSELAQVKYEAHDPAMIRVGDMAFVDGLSVQGRPIYGKTLAVTRDANIDKPSKPTKPIAVKPEPRKPTKEPKPEQPAVAEKPADPAPMPAANPDGPPRPKTKGKVLIIN